MGALRARMPSLRRVLTVLGTLVVIAMVVPFAVFAVPQVVGADHGFVILSGSMEPAVSPGDVVIVDASAPVEVGDVITFDDGKEIPTTHRVIGVEDGQYLTQGDANPNPDGAPIPPDAVLGRVTFTIPEIGHVILWVNTPVGYISLVLVPILLLVGNELLAWARRDGDSEGDGESPPASVDDGDSGETPTASAAETPPGTVAVAVADLKLTTLAMAGLVGYAAWNVYGEVTATGAPSPVSVAAATGGALGLLFAGWVTTSAWLRARRERATADESSAEETALSESTADESPPADDGLDPEATAVQTDGGAAGEGAR
jgi:signal peptidase